MNTTIKNIKNLTKGADFVVALSGGVDSVYLLHAAHKVTSENKSQKIKAVHVNHNINKKSGDWALFCSDLCSNLNIEFVSKDVYVDSTEGNIEEIARELRYCAIADEMKDGDILLTAQHLNDQIETFFIRLKRGGGVKGLGGIRPMSTREISGKSIKIVRPMLDLKKKDITEFAKDKDYRWVEDDSNSDNKYDRNFIRNCIIPHITGRWGDGVLRAISRSIELCRETDETISILLEDKLNSCGKWDINRVDKLPVETLTNPKIQRELIRHWLTLNNISKLPSKKILEQVIEQLLINYKPTSSANVKISSGATESHLRRYGEFLYLINDKANEVAKKSYTRDKEIGSKTHRGTEGMFIMRGEVKVSLNEHLRRKKIPSWERNYIPYEKDGDIVTKIHIF